MIDIDLYISENQQRYTMLQAACRKLTAEGTAITAAALGSELPLDFALDSSGTLDPWRLIAAETQRSVADGTMTATEAPDTAAPAPVEPDPASRESLAAQKLELERRACELRGELHHLTVERANARARFADALQVYMTGLPKVTFESNARDYIAASIADRAENHIPQVRTFGPSTLDRQCGYSAGGDANDHARKTMRGSGHRRGAFPSSMRGAKLPSQS